MTEKAQTGQAMVGTAQLAALLMITTERVRQLSRQGYIPKASRDSIPLVGGVQGYIRFLKDDERRTSKSASAARLQEERAAEIAQRRAERARELIPLAEAIAALDAVVGMVRSELSAVPAMVTRDLRQREVIEDTLNGALGRVSAALRARAVSLETGGNALAAEREDDA